MILEIFYNVWILGIAIFVFNAFSRLLFTDKQHLKGNIKMFFITSAFACVWPFSCMSPEGRKLLFGKIHKL
jgi:hypothetical protein